MTAGTGSGAGGAAVAADSTPQPAQDAADTLPEPLPLAAVSRAAAAPGAGQCCTALRPHREAGGLKPGQPPEARHRCDSETFY